MKFHTRLKAARARSGLSLREVKEKAGCSHSYVSRLEHGYDLPTAAIVAKLSVALDTDADELCELAGILPVDVERAVAGYGKGFWDLVRRGEMERVFVLIKQEEEKKCKR